MKNPVLKTAVVLLLAASLYGCGNDQYAIEKKYYVAQRQAEKIFKNPHGSPPNELQRVVNSFSDFSRKFPKSNLAVNAELTIARLYIVKQEYDKAREQLKKVLNSYAKNTAISSEAVFLIGNSYEIENKWNQALAEYKRIIKEYPLTPKGLSLPLYMVQHYKIKFQADKMVEACREAISHYKSLAEKYPDSPLAYNASLLVAECYGVLKEWPSAIDTYNNIIDTYKDKLSVDGILINIATIYSRQLHDHKSAKETLERMLRDYPKSRLRNTAKQLLKSLKDK